MQHASKQLARLFLILALLITATGLSASPASAAPALVLSNLSGAADASIVAQAVATNFTTPATESYLPTSVKLAFNPSAACTISAGLYSDNAGLPGTLLLTISSSTTVPASSVRSYIDIPFPSSYALAASTTYWVVVTTPNCYASATQTQATGTFTNTTSLMGPSWFDITTAFGFYLRWELYAVDISGDTTPPTVNVPADKTVEATGPGGAVVDFSTEVSATDDVYPSNPSVTCDPTSGSTFPLGSTQVTCQATDYNNNPGSASFTINVQDTTDPTLTLPGDMTVEATSAAGATVTYTASASDLVGLASFSCTPASGSTFALGATPVNCSASDTAGNTANSSFTVAVADTTDPTLTLPNNMTVEATGPDGAVVDFNATATDLVGPPNPTVMCEPASGYLFPLGTTTVSCIAWDGAQNFSDSTFDVTVVDTTPPSLHMPANITVPQTSPAGAVVTFTATATDLVNPNPTVTCAPASGSTFPLGTTTVECTATDEIQIVGDQRFSNVSKGTFTVTVTPIASNNLLQKPGFEGPYTLPYAWSMYNSSTPLTKWLDCVTFLSKPCSIKITGNRSNTNYEIFQKVKRAGLIGDKYSFGLSSRALKVPTAGRYQVEVTFYNAWNKILGTSVLKLTPGNHGFQKFTATATAPANYTHMVFRFIFQKTTGTAWFDDAFLSPMR